MTLTADEMEAVLAASSELIATARQARDDARRIRHEVAACRIALRVAKVDLRVVREVDIRQRQPR